MTMPLFLQRLLLIAVLLFSQQVAFAHAQEHQLEGTASDKQACEQCVLAAQLGGAPTSDAPRVQAVAGHAMPACPVHSIFLPGAFAPFSSRAPPALS